MNTHSISVSGGTMNAYVAYPAQLPAPVLIVIQEIFGVNDEIKSRCEMYAKEGYIAIAPDMFWRIEPNVSLTDKTKEEWDKAFALMNAFDTDQGVEDLKATLDYARKMEGSNGKVGNIGFCLGGKLSYLMAARTDVDATVSYYGVGLQDMLGEMDNIQTPTDLYIASLDKFTPPEAQAQIVSASQDHQNVTTYVYEGVDHAFARLGGEHYDEQATALAYKRAMDLFQRALKD